MTSSIFKKTIFISLLGHITAFSIFNLSFGNRFLKADYRHVFFLGGILSGSELSRALPPDTKSNNFNFQIIKNRFMARSDTLPDKNINKALPFTVTYYAKPTINLAFNPDKLIFAPKITALSGKIMGKPVIMFYPQLPYNFLLYFKDRQTVHIELMFNIMADETKKAIVVKRKISSGNLEADLLSMRYISHYLFIKQANFMANNWQTVKIDLSTKND